MALTQCKECSKEVSTLAVTCPHCGVSSPGIKDASQTSKQAKPAAALSRSNNVGCGTALVVVIVVLVVIGKCSGDNKSTTSPSASSTPPELSDAECKKDLTCWGNRKSIEAGVYCKRDIERLAKYSTRWTDGFLDSKISRFKWLNKERGTVTFIGDKIEFQNGFGAYQNMIYQCDFDPAGNKVLDVRAYPGRLPD